jgi:hypothetical protein
MAPGWLQWRRTRLWVILLLLPALACRVLMPPGFMPGTGANHAPTVQMCHGYGPLPHSAAPEDTNPAPSPHRDTRHEAPCVFAAAGTTAPPPISIALADGPAAPEELPPPPQAVVTHRTQHQPQSARAPPLNDQPA